MNTWTPAALRSQVDHARAAGLMALLVAGAHKSGLPPAYVVAVASRETRIQNILGDGGHGHGVLQIDDRRHPSVINAHPDWRQNAAPLIDYGCELLRTNVAWAGNRFPDLDAAGRLTLAAAAYNAGPSGAAAGHQAGDCDIRTAGGNYGEDVMDRMQAIAELL